MLCMLCMLCMLFKYSCHDSSRFAKDEEDGLIEREIMSGDVGQMIIYIVEVHTGNVSGAGTDANVFISLGGEKVSAFQHHKLSVT
jgi:hypothetical protein